MNGVMESIGFTMCFLLFCVSVITFWGSKNASIFLNGNFSERKVNVDGTWASQKSNFLNTF